MECCVILVTCKDAFEAQKISERLLQRHQAACVNIVSQVVSLFCWQGRQEQSQEALLVIKTRAVLFEAVRTTVRECHSYETPEIIALPVIAGDTDYLDWVASETEMRTQLGKEAV